MVLNVIKEIKKLSTIHVTGAVSNVSSNLPLRKIINQAFVCYEYRHGQCYFRSMDKTPMGMVMQLRLSWTDDYCGI